LVFPFSLLWPSLLTCSGHASVTVTQAIHQGCISDKVNKVAERVHLIYWGLKEEIANRKIALMQTMVDRIDHYDRLRDLRHDSSVAVTKFILLILEHFSNRIVSYI